MIRSGNEDNFAAEADAQRGLFIVADGMGGHAAGEVASEMAVQIVQRELTGIRDLETNGVDRQVMEALKSANRKIHERTMIEVDKQGMGTTVSVLIIAGHRYLIGQVGDSRVYLLRDGALIQLTKNALDLPLIASGGIATAAAPPPDPPGSLAPYALAPAPA